MEILTSFDDRTVGWWCIRGASRLRLRRRSSNGFGIRRIISSPVSNTGGLIRMIKLRNRLISASLFVERGFNVLISFPLFGSFDNNVPGIWKSEE